MPDREVTINIHDLLKVKVQSTIPSYLSYLKEELPSCFLKGELGTEEPVGITIAVSPSPFDVTEQSIYVRGRFKKIYPFECLIEHLEHPETTVRFKPPRWGYLVPANLGAIFFHNQILEPLMYYKLLKAGVIMLHASAVEREGNVYIFCGVSGSGKTSLAFRLSNDGYSFLGDDAIFISRTGEVFSYAKRVHYFSYLKKKNPFLRTSVGLDILARSRETARMVMAGLFGERFYLSTRLHLKQLIPHVSLSEGGKIKKIFLIGFEGADSIQDIVASSDSRSFLCGTLLKERATLTREIKEREEEIINGALGKSERIRVDHYEKVFV